jgi:hypothetical protein
MGWPTRAAFLAAGILLLLPFQAAAINGWLNAAGAALMAVLIALELRAKRRLAPA